MSNVQEIITFADRKFSNTEAIANKITDIDGIHKRIFIKINRLTNIYVKRPDVTTANQLVYTRPSDISPENIFLIQVSDLSGTTWYPFKYVGIRDHINDGRYWTITDDGNIALSEYGEVIKENDRGIWIYGFKDPATINSLTQTPELSSLYHDLLKYAEIVELANGEGGGHNPDTEIADYYQKKYDEFMMQVESHMSDGIQHRGTRSCQAEEEW